MQRHSAWQTILGDFTLEALDADVIHAARNELAALPALTYYGTDHDGKPISAASRATLGKLPPR